MTHETFARWLAAYGQASVDDDPQASAALFSANARYYESPFDEPLIGRQAILDYWAAGAQNFTGKTATYRIVTLQGNVGVAQWRAQFTVEATGERKALDCLFLLEFDEQGLCCLFREWWHIRSFDEVNR